MDDAVDILNPHWQYISKLRCQRITHRVNSLWGANRGLDKEELQVGVANGFGHEVAVEDKVRVLRRCGKLREETYCDGSCIHISRRDPIVQPHQDRIAQLDIILICLFTRKNDPIRSVCQISEGGLGCRLEETVGRIGNLTELRDINTVNCVLLS